MYFLYRYFLIVHKIPIFSPKVFWALCTMLKLNPVQWRQMDILCIQHKYCIHMHTVTCLHTHLILRYSALNWKHFHDLSWEIVFITLACVHISGGIVLISNFCRKGRNTVGNAILGQVGLGFIRKPVDWANKQFFFMEHSEIPAFWFLS